ncbi:uncharacterized protein LOC124889575 [Capsicum annuum]|uniref:uncharacterized protein LOC124889575 n=1 Tax=Capsicum annuum TaxID=4072 RepID=UPI001FB07FAD|nr:uncharacterized protein LOC124889575 [Capsicum annuum]
MANSDDDEVTLLDTKENLKNYSLKELKFLTTMLIDTINELTKDKECWKKDLEKCEKEMVELTVQVSVRFILNKNPYELITKRKFKLSYFKLFGCKFYVLNNEKNGLEKFDPRSDDGVFVGYSSTIKAYKIYNKRTQCVEKSIHVMFDDASGTTGGSTPDDDNSGNPLNVPKKFDEGDDDGDSQQWKEDFEFALGMTDIDQALSEDDPPALIDSSTAAEKEFYAK